LSGAEEADQERNREKVFESIRDRFFLFNARGFFHQVMQKMKHHRGYRTLQRIFQIEEMQQDLNQKIKDMYDYLMMVKSDRMQKLAEIESRNEELKRLDVERQQKAAEERSKLLEKRLSAIAWIIGLPVLLLTFQQSAIGVSMTISLILLAVGIVLGLAVYFIIQYFTENNEEDNRPKG